MVPVFAQSDCFYENELYDFSFNVPCDTVYWENVTILVTGVTYQVAIIEEDYTWEELKARGYGGSFADITGLPFANGVPWLGVSFGNISEVKLPELNSRVIENYEREFVATYLGGGKILELEVEQKSWGWKAKTRVAYSFYNSQFVTESQTYYFKDREYYVVSYDSLEELFKPSHHLLETALESLEIKGIKVNEPEIIPVSLPSDGGGCLIATATYGTELAPQVQMLREIRDNSLLQTPSGKSFMEGFNAFYYSFSPTIADYERQNPVFKEVVKVTITPLLVTLSILNYVDLDSEESVLGYGIGIILMNIGMYFVAPAIVIRKIKSR